MRKLTLAGTNIETSAIGLGCATLFHLPKSEDRRNAVEAAYEAGIRHFDVAPIYGLGLAESELGAQMRHRRNTITIATKFGISMTQLGRFSGRVQLPVRVALSRMPRLSGGVKKSGQGPTSGTTGKLLYAADGYTVRAATSGLEQSLRRLRTDYLDLFLLHDPPSDSSARSADVAAYLESRVDAGTIRGWGIAADMNGAASFQTSAPFGRVLQTRDDILAGNLPPSETPAGARITFGIMERALPAVRRYLDQFPNDSHTWSRRLGVDLNDETSLPNLLVRQALRRNPYGPVLFSSTRSDRIRSAASQAEQVDHDSSLAADEVRTVNELATAVNLSIANGAP